MSNIETYHVLVEMAKNTYDAEKAQGKFFVQHQVGGFDRIRPHIDYRFLHENHVIASEILSWKKIESTPDYMEELLKIVYRQAHRAYIGDGTGH